MQFIHKYLSQSKQVIEKIDCEQIANVIQVLKNVRKNHGRLFLIGSGGGAGHASHATCDFRKLGGFEAYCPLDNISELTARINDEGWDSSIANYLMASKIHGNDCLFVFSVGGGSEERNISGNLVGAIKMAKKVGAKVVGIVGKDGGYTAKNADASILVPTVDDLMITPHTEGMQAVLWHLIISHPELKLHQTKWESVQR